MSKHAGDMPPPPPFVNWYADVAQWWMLKNDEIGDCVVAAVLHSIYQQMCYAHPGHAPVPTDTEALTIYSAVGGYVPEEPCTDQGLYVLGPGGMMDYWFKTGVTCGGVHNKPAAFMSIIRLCPEEWQQAIATFGGLLVGIDLPANVVAEDETPFVWNDPGGPRVGGHEIYLVGYQPSPDGMLYDLVSWGQHYRATEAFLMGCLTEALAVVNTAFINDEGKAPSGLDLEGLMADMALMQHRPVAVSLPHPVPVQVMDSFTGYMLPIIVQEGGGVLTDNPDDMGGCTIWGITEVTARQAGYTEAMKDMDSNTALAIYRTHYWERPGFNEIDLIFCGLAQYMLDIGINLGPDVPSAFLQRGLNVLNNQGKLYDTIVVDGKCGPKTRAALAAYRSARPVSEGGDDVLMGVIRALAVERYIQIAESNPTQAVFEFGWLRNRALGISPGN